MIAHHSESHVRQFKEDKLENRAPMFPDGQAIIEIDDYENYEVHTIAGEVLFIGRGYDEALFRIKYAESSVSIDVVKDGKKYTAAQFKQNDWAVNKEKGRF